MKTTEETKENLDVRYYYVRDCEPGSSSASRPPYGIVCLIKDNEGKFHRGISICSPEEQSFNRPYGRKIALGRAKKAKGTKKNSLPIALAIHCRSMSKPEILRGSGVIFASVLKNCYGLEPQYKSWFNVELTEFEKHIFSD